MTDEKQPEEHLAQDQESREERLKRITEELSKTEQGKKIIEDKKDDQCCS